MWARKHEPHFFGAAGDQDAWKREKKTVNRSEKAKKKKKAFHQRTRGEVTQDSAVYAKQGGGVANPRRSESHGDHGENTN